MPIQQAPAPYETLQQVAGNSTEPDTTGDPGDQPFITGSKVASRAGNPQMIAAKAFGHAQSIGPMLKAAGSIKKSRKKRGQ